jgi:hypothetical protein
MDNIRQFLISAGLPGEDAPVCATSALRFPDGGQYRIEIPSTEGPRSLTAVLDEADLRQVPVHRISQGSGIMLLTDEEIREMSAIGVKHSIEVNLFLGPRASFDIGAQAFSAAGKSLALSQRGSNQLAQGLADVERAVELGIRSVLVSDLGSLEMVAEMRAEGLLPRELIIKTSVMMAPANPASARILERLGADTINVPSDLTMPQIASIRAAITKPIDFYVEAPDNIGGFLRYYEIPELIRVAAPIYLKFGLRNSPDVYPSGTHLENTVIALSKERVRRAQIACEHIERLCPEMIMSPLGAEDLGIPIPPDH